MFLLVVSVQVLSCVLIYIGCDTRSPSGVCTTTDSWMQNERLGNATGITDKVSKMRICRTHRFTSHNLPPPLLTPISSTGRSVPDCCVRLQRNSLYSTGNTTAATAGLCFARSARPTTCSCRSSGSPRRSACAWGATTPH